MVNVVVAAAVLGALATLAIGNLRALKSWAPQVARREKIFRVGDEGIWLVEGNELQGWIRWTDIRRIRTFKLDCLTTDLVCLTLESQAGACFVIHEEHEQWAEIVRAVQTRVGGFEPDWFEQVAFPAFATNERVLFPRD
jgi:hypothetical protein